MAKPAKWKIDKLDARENVSISQLSRKIKSARQRVAMIVHGAARDRGLVISGRNREKLYQQIGNVYLQLDNGLKDWGKDIIEKGAIDWHDAAIRDITGQTGTDPSNAVTKFSREYAEDVFKRVHPENGRSLAAVLTDRMAQDDIKALRRVATDAFREAAVSGATMTDIAASIKGKWDGVAGDMSAAKFIDAAGRKWDDGRYLQMLVRTTTARVARDSYFDTLAKNGDDLSIIQNVDGDACDICSAWDGVIISITGASGKYPSYNQALNAGWGHPNCRCMAERVDETIDAEAIKDQGETATPDLVKRDNETDTEYRNRATDAMKEYSDKFTIDGTLAPEPDPVQPPESIPVIKEVSQEETSRTQMQNDVKAMGYEWNDKIAQLPDAVIKTMGTPPKMQINSEAKFNPTKNIIMMPTDSSSWHGHPLVFDHELGHKLHFSTEAITSKGIDDGLAQVMNDDLLAWKSAAKETRGKDWASYYARKNSAAVLNDFVIENKLGKNYFEAGTDMKHRAVGFADTLGGLSKGKYGIGHSVKYYKGFESVNGKMEAFANIYRGIVNDWPEYESAFPLTTKWIKGRIGL